MYDLKTKEIKNLVKSFLIHQRWVIHGSRSLIYRCTVLWHFMTQDVVLMRFKVDVQGLHTRPTFSCFKPSLHVLAEFSILL